MRVLAFDTCLNACSAALTDAGGTVLAARRDLMRVGHAERLCPMIEEVMAEAGVAFANLEAIAVTVGPGTFTGIRIGIAAARGFALATGLGVHGTTSLALLAATARAALPEADRTRPIAACHDARKGEVLLELLPADTAPGLDRVRLMSPDAAAALIVRVAPDSVLIGSGANLVATAAAATGKRLEATLPDIEPDARHLALLSLTPMTHPAPLYPRPPDAKPPADPSFARL